MIYLGTCLIAYTGIKGFCFFYLKEYDNDIVFITICNMILVLGPIMVEIIWGIEQDDFKELVVSKEDSNKQKGFQKVGEDEF